MSRVAFLGLGAMGSRMAHRLIAAGHEVTVWNRTPERTGSLVKAGARLEATPRAAAKDAEFVFSMVRDDGASSSVWLDDQTGAAGAMQPCCIGIECSTVSIGWSRKLFQEGRNRGVTLLDAPVVGSRPQAEGGQLVALVGGEPTDVERVTPVLRSFAATVLHAGPPSSGAATKLAINGLFAAQVVAIAEALALVSEQGGSLARFLDGLSATPVLSPAARMAGSLMIRGEHGPLFPIELAAKDLAYLVQEAGEVGLPVPLLTRVWEIFNEAAGAGLAGLNLTSVCQRYRRAGRTGSHFS